MLLWFQIIAQFALIVPAYIVTQYPITGSCLDIYATEARIFIATNSYTVQLDALTGDVIKTWSVCGNNYCRTHFRRRGSHLYMAIGNEIIKFDLRDSSESQVLSTCDCFDVTDDYLFMPTGAEIGQYHLDNGSLVTTLPSITGISAIKVGDDGYYVAGNPQGFYKYSFNGTRLYAKLAGNTLFGFDVREGLLAAPNWHSMSCYIYDALTGTQLSTVQHPYRPITARLAGDDIYIAGTTPVMKYNRLTGELIESYSEHPLVEMFHLIEDIALYTCGFDDNIVSIFDFREIVVLSTSQTVFSTEGMQFLTINFLFKMYTNDPARCMPFITVGPSNCTSVTWYNSTMLSCLIPPGVGADVQVKFDFRPCNISQIPRITISYMPPSIDAISFSSDDCVGHQSLQLNVSNAGPFQQDNFVYFESTEISLAPIPCTHLVLLSPKSIQCLTPQAPVSGKYRIKIVVGGQHSYFNSTFTYHAPRITGFQNPGPYNITGSDLLLIIGENFGNCTLCNDITLSVTIDGSACTSPIRHSNTLISCRTPSGIGANLSTIVTINGYSNAPNGLFSYNHPRVTFVSPSQSTGASLEQVTISGANFGIRSSLIRVLLRSQSGNASTIDAQNVNWQTDGLLTCQIQTDTMLKDFYFISVIVGGQESKETSVMYRNTNANMRPSILPQSISIKENEAKRIILQASDADNDIVFVYISRLPSRGALYQYSIDASDSRGVKIVTSNALVTDSDRRVWFIPDSNVNGEDFFEFYAQDARIAISETARVSLLIEEVNQPPSINDMTISTPGDTPVNFTLAASDPDNSTFMFTVLTLPVHGILLFQSSPVVTAPFSVGFAKNLNFTFEPVTYEHGISYAQIEWICSDGSNNSTIARVTINVQFRNHAPLALASNSVTQENTDVLIFLNATEYDTGQTLTATIRKLPINGTLFQVSPSGAKAAPFVITNQQVEDTFRRVIYSPKQFFNGIDAFEWIVTDTLQSSSTTSRSVIEVGSVNQPPSFDIQEVDAKLAPKSTLQFSIPINDVDETIVLYVSSLQGRPERGIWTDGSGKTLDFTKYSVLLTQLPMVLRVDHDDKGGGFPYASLTLVAYDSLNAMSENRVMINVAVDCPPGLVNNIWGASGDLCVSCPEGAICSREGEFLPLNAKGYFRINNSTFVRCYPEEACPEGVSQNATACGTGYSGLRCGQCSPGFYRYGNGCRKCPDELPIFVLVIIAVVVL